MKTTVKRKMPSGNNYDYDVLAETQNFLALDIPSYSRIDIRKKKQTAFEKKHLLGGDNKGSVYLHKNYYSISLQNVIYKKDLLEIVKLLVQLGIK